MYRVIFEKSVLKFFQKHKSEKIITQLKKSIEKLQQNPLDETLDVKSLKWFDWKYRLRIWDYRFIYEVDNEEIIIIFIYAWNRWDVYKKI